jgi:drug/metabolite transporter (DMT)-like permease
VRHALAGGSTGLARHRWLPYALVTISMLIYASSYVVGRAARDEIPPIALAFWRAALACAILLPFVWTDLKRNVSVLRRHWRLVVLLGLTQSIIGQALVFWALHTTTAINVALISSLQPVFIMALAAPLIGERMTNRQRLGIAIAFVGGLIAITRGDPAALLDLALVAGDLLILIATVSWSIYTVLIKRAPADVNPFVVFFALTAVGAAILLPLHLAEAALQGGYFTPTAGAVAAALYIAVFNSIVALVFLNIGIVRLGPSRVAVFYYLMPVFTALIAVVALDEMLRFYHFACLALVAAGVFLTGRAPPP